MIEEINVQEINLIIVPIDRIIYLNLGMRLNDIVWQLHLYICIQNLLWWMKRMKFKSQVKYEIGNLTYFFFLLNKEIDKVKYIWNLSRRFLDTIHVEWFLHYGVNLLRFSKSHSLDNRRPFIKSQRYIIF